MNDADTLVKQFADKIEHSDFRSRVGIFIKDKDFRVTIDAKERPVVLNDAEPSYTVIADFDTLSQIMDGRLDAVTAISKFPFRASIKPLSKMPAAYEYLLPVLIAK